MNKQGTAMKVRSSTKYLAVWAGFVAVLLMVPFLANAPWTGTDYIFAGSVLFGAGLGYELATRNIQDAQKRLLIGIGVALMVVFIWGLAVAD